MTLIQFQTKFINAGFSVQDSKLASHVLFFTAGIAIELSNPYWNSFAVDAYMNVASIYQ